MELYENTFYLRYVNERFNFSFYSCFIFCYLRMEIPRKVRKIIVPAKLWLHVIEKTKNKENVRHHYT